MRWLAAVALCLVVGASARADDWGARRDPFDPQVVRRYKQILARDPHDEGALRHLVELYQRYRTVAKLEAEYQKDLEGHEDWATLVVIARLPRKSRQDTLLWWRRAVHVKPDDAQGWLAVGDAEASDPAAAADAYKRATQLVTTPAKKKIALQKLASAARIAGDAVTVDGAYVELIALSPKDGGLWLDRGNAQLGAKQFAGALDSFGAAEPLLRTDPERQLTAITSHGMALDGLGRPDDAIAEYVRALDHAPPGYYLRQELVSRIVDVDRRRKQLPNAIERLEKRWPEKTRGYFEWSTLGDLYKETHDDERALAAYERAVAKAPTEVTTQRKLIALLDKLRAPEEALAAHEAAARIAPGDADLQLELAKRYHTESHDKAYATLEALARRMNRNVGVLGTIASLYEQWDEVPRAIKHYETIASVEPNEPDHAVVLGEAYWRADDQPRARLAWYRLDKIGTPEALYRHGEVLALHDLWNEAITPYSKALALDGSKPDVWYGRARAYDSLSKFPAALEDARRAVALTGYASQADGLRYRQLLVRVLSRVEKTPETDLGRSVATWRFAFDHGDAAAGYLLAAHHARLSSYQLHDVLEKLYRIVPTDDSLGIALARSYEHRREFDHARTDLEEIARRSPARAQEIGKLLAELDKERERAEQQIRWEEEGKAPRMVGRPDLVGRDRVGWRFELGADVRNTGAAVLGLGMYTSHHVAPGTAVSVRLDWTQRSDVMAEADAYALGGVVSTRVLDLRKVEVSLGAGARGELRYGREGSGLDRAALAGDLTLEVLPRGVPAVVGVRLDQSLTDDVKATSLLVELGFEVR